MGNSPSWQGSPHPCASSAFWCSPTELDVHAGNAGNAGAAVDAAPLIASDDGPSQRDSVVVAQLRAELVLERTARQRAEKLRAEDRAGRCRAERELRDLARGGPAVGALSAADRNVFDGASGGATATAAATTAATATATDNTNDTYDNRADTHTLYSIGEMRSVFNSRNGCPRQGQVSPHARSELRISSDLTADILAGLEGFSHLWLLFVFHDNTNDAKRVRRQDGSGRDDEDGDADDNDDGTASAAGEGGKKKAKKKKKKGQTGSKRRFLGLRAKVKGGSTGRRGVGVLLS